MCILFRSFILGYLYMGLLCLFQDCNCSCALDKFLEFQEDMEFGIRHEFQLHMFVQLNGK